MLALYCSTHQTDYKHDTVTYVIFCGLVGWRWTKTTVNGRLPSALAVALAFKIPAGVISKRGLFWVLELPSPKGSAEARIGITSMKIDEQREC